MADGVAEPRWRQLGGMSRIQAHMADFMIVDIEHGDAVRLLDQFHAEVIKDERHPAGPTLVDRIFGTPRRGEAAKRHGLDHRR
jgi:hypothetical protein